MMRWENDRTEPKTADDRVLEIVLWLVVAALIVFASR